MVGLIWSSLSFSTLQWSGLQWSGLGGGGVVPPDPPDPPEPPEPTGVAKEEVLWRLNTPMEFTDVPASTTRQLQSPSFPYSRINGKHIKFQALWGRDGEQVAATAGTFLTVFLDWATPNPSHNVAGAPSGLQRAAYGCQQCWNFLTIGQTCSAEMRIGSGLTDSYGTTTSGGTPTYGINSLINQGDETELCWSLALRDLRTEAGRKIMVDKIEVIAYDWL